MARLGTTRYGLSLTFADSLAKNSSKSVNGFNFGGTSSIANEAALFTWGNTENGGTFPGLNAFVGTGYTLTDVDVTARNQVQGQTTIVGGAN